MRAYIRIDPQLAERKEGTEDGLVVAFIKTLCFAEQQPHRGRFKNLAIFRAYLGRHARWIPRLVTAGDVQELHDGSYYVDGWDEWQEGNWQVGERMKLVRERKRRSGVTEHVTLTVTDDVTRGVTEDVTVSSEPLAVSGKPLAVSGKRLAVSSSVTGDESPHDDGASAGAVIASRGWRGGEEPISAVLQRLRRPEVVS